MKANKKVLPYFLVKPYCAQHLPLLRRKIFKGGLKICAVYALDSWAEISREIYQGTIEKEGYGFKVGMEGHIKLVNYFFGNRCLFLMLKSNHSSVRSPEKTFVLVQKIKREFRGALLGGEDRRDLIVAMNLSNMEIEVEPEKFCHKGVLGVKSGNNFSRFSSCAGWWDYYFFKYIHTPSSYEELGKEWRILKNTGVFSPKNRVSLLDFQKMVGMKVLVPSRLFNR